MLLPVFNQILLFVVVTVLTTLLVLSGIQVVQFLREIRQTIKKLNKVIDNVGEISDSVSKPIVSASNFVMGLKSGVDLINLISKLKDKKDGQRSE